MFWWLFELRNVTVNAFELGYSTLLEKSFANRNILLVSAEGANFFVFFMSRMMSPHTHPPIKFVVSE